MTDFSYPLLQYRLSLQYVSSSNKKGVHPFKVMFKIIISRFGEKEEDIEVKEGGRGGRGEEEQQQQQ